MKTKLLSFLLLLSLTLMAQTNLVPNGNFETWTSSSQPDNWYRYFSGLVSQSSTAQNGNSSTNMQIVTGTSNFINSEYFAVQSGKTYRVTLYHKALSGTFSSLDFSVYHKPGTFKEEVIKKSDAVFSTSEWRKVEFEYKPTVSENIEIDVWTYGTLNSEILVDNISVVDVADVPGLYTLIPDGEFERYLGYLGYDKDGINGKVLTSAISSVKTFDLSYYQWNITDLTGIEGFTALENLTFRGNTGSLTSLNVSKNLLLKTLDCSSNKLTTLDVSNNLALESLICRSNKLTALDVSKNLKLKILNFDGNQITSIPVAANKQLVEFNCYNNKITSLDVSQNILLTDLNCGVNQITALNISYNVLLKNLNCNNNKLTELNLSKNNKLEVVRADNNSLVTLDLSQQPNLKTLECYRNKITNLNISKNPLLTSLACYNNELTQLDVSNNKELVAIDCLSNRLKNLDLTQNTKLVTLAAHYNDLTKIDLSNNSSLKYLTINYNELSDIDLSNNLLLEYFNGSNNPIENLDLSKNIGLTSVALQETKIESLNLSFNTKLTSANLASSKLLYDLNLKNGNNTALDINLLNALNLTCVLVDNKVYADTKWGAKKEIWTRFSEDCRPYTIIPDSFFEDKLIALKIDIDGKNGQVLTSSIATIKTLDVSNSSISDLTGIQDFASLETLNCKDNQLLYLDLSKNSALTSLNAANNKLVSLDLKNGKNTLLDKNTSLFTSNINLKCIQVDDQSYSTANWAGLKDATANYNTLCNAFIAIPDSNFENKLIDLGIDIDGKNGKVLTSSIATITTLDVSSGAISNLSGIEGFVALKQLNFSSNNLKAVDLTKNVALTSLNATSNQLLNLDLSKNSVLVQVDCSANNLFSLNLKNGNNLNFTGGNFKNNPKLTCIQVDDKDFSDTNWPNLKETTVSYALVCDDNSFTLIPDAVFENRLIQLGIDKDGANGGVLTSSISSLKEVSLYRAQGSLEPAIQDLTGIQDFKALEKLSVSNNKLSELDLSGNVALTEVSCGYNRLSKINLSKNILLTKVDCPNNYLTQIDFSKNTELFTVNCQENQLTSLDFSKNPKFNYLYAHTNKLTSLNLTANPNLGYLNCAKSLLENLDLSNNKYIMYLFCEGNRFKTLDVSGILSLSQFGCDNNLLTTINVSKNTNLSHFSCSGNQLTVLDLSSNSNLWTLYCQNNQLTALNISKNKKLESINCSSNNLVSLNIKNGNNINFEGLTNDYSIDFKNNPNLTCIQVDDITFANEKMAAKKDATATYNTNCGSTLVLPHDNFTVETKGESCLGENNGEINITANATYVYEAIISGITYPFSDNSLKIASLAPGTYTISITIPDENFEQNFNFIIAKAATTTGKSSITSKKVNVEITEGTAPFTISIDGSEKFQTSDSNFSIELKEGGLLEVATAKACEGIYAKMIKTADISGTILSAYPNPTTGIFEIEVPTNKNEVAIELYNFGGQLISSKKYVIENGTAKLSLENQPSGIYAAKIYLETPEYIKIIKK